MANRTTTMTESLYAYLVSVSVREPQVTADLRAETAKLSEAGMQIGPDQGQCMLGAGTQTVANYVRRTRLR